MLFRGRGNAQDQSLSGAFVGYRVRSAFARLLGPMCTQELALDVGLMQQGAQVLLGRHDFSAFMDDRRPAGKAVGWFTCFWLARYWFCWLIG